MQINNVLLVDDEKHVLNSLKRLLESKPYNLLVANTCNNALYTLCKKEIKVIIADYKMPDMSGIEFLQRVKQTNPESVRLILSGFADIDVILEAVNKQEIYRFIQKPWNDIEIDLIITQAIAHYNTIKQNRELSTNIKLHNRSLEQTNKKLITLLSVKSKSLHMHEKVLLHLPYPVVYINNDLKIIFYNKSLELLYPKLPKPLNDSHVTTILPYDVVPTLERTIQNFNEVNYAQCKILNKEFFLKMIPMVTNQLARTPGCAVIFEQIIK
ncbi:MAG: response regulator [Planctomycetes bacterium]|nr:response regulator [Planctomycetota bacterium]